MRLFMQYRERFLKNSILKDKQVACCYVLIDIWIILCCYTFNYWELNPDSCLLAAFAPNHTYSSGDLCTLWVTQFYMFNHFFFCYGFAFLFHAFLQGSLEFCHASFDNNKPWISMFCYIFKLFSMTSLEITNWDAKAGAHIWDFGWYICIPRQEQGWICQQKWDGPSYKRNYIRGAFFWKNSHEKIWSVVSSFPF